MNIELLDLALHAARAAAALVREEIGTARVADTKSSIVDPDGGPP